MDNHIIANIIKTHLNSNARAHQQMNNLVAAIKVRAERSEISELIPLLEKLTRLFETHFAAESEMMAVLDYPERFRHEFFHEKLLQRVQILCAARAEAIPDMDYRIEALIDYLTAHSDNFDAPLEHFATQFIDKASQQITPL